MSEIIYRRAKPSVFFEPAAAITLLQLVRAAQITKTEISAMFCMIPCNEDQELQPKVENIPYMLTPKHPNLSVLSGVFPKQTCSEVETLFEMSDADAKALEQLKDAYPDEDILASEKTWVHKHPGGVNPSGTDENNVADKMAMSMYYLMIIINESFLKGGMDPKDLYARLMISTNTIEPMLVYNKAEERFEWDGKSTRFKQDPFIKQINLLNHAGCQDFIMEGHYPIYWRNFFRNVYNDIMSKTPNKSGYEVWNGDSKCPIFLPSIDEICSRVSTYKDVYGKKKSYNSFEELLNDGNKKVYHKSQINYDDDPRTYRL